MEVVAVLPAGEAAVPALEVAVPAVAAQVPVSLSVWESALGSLSGSASRSRPGYYSRVAQLGLE
ncbi:MAG: hypothetical protein M3256_22665 [Actinomycetota bacterium]|nr:hypothetical protein [Actinomycetota bacterium]